MKTLKFYSLFLIITLLGCTEENYYTTAEGLGKVNVYIEGDITNAEAQAQLEEEVGSITENIFIQNTSQLTNLNISVPIYIRKILFSNCESLINISISGQGTAMPFTEISVGGPNAQNITINGITELSDLGISGAVNNATHLICNDLIKIKNYFGFSFNHLYENTAKLNDLKYASTPNGYCTLEGKFSVLEFNALKELPNSDFSITIDEFSLPSLQNATSLIFGYYGYLGISTLNFPSLTRCDNVYLRNDYDTAINVYMPLLNYCLTYQSRGIELESSSINSILHQFLNIQPSSGKSLFFEDSAQPTGQGLIDKQTLINQGNTVTIY